MLTDIPVVENLSYLSTEQGHPLVNQSDQNVALLYARKFTVER